MTLSKFLEALSQDFPLSSLVYPLVSEPGLDSRASSLKMSSCLLKFFQPFIHSAVSWARNSLTVLTGNIEGKLKWECLLSPRLREICSSQVRKQNPQQKNRTCSAMFVQLVSNIWLYYTTSHEGLGHSQILVSVGVLKQPPWMPILMEQYCVVCPLCDLTGVETGWDICSSLLFSVGLCSGSFSNVLSSKVRAEANDVPP